MKTIQFLLFPLLLSSLFCTAQNDETVSGIVFHDTNKNGVYDSTDTPLKNIAVSTMSKITQTNAEGLFQLPLQKKDIVFVIKPADFEFPLQTSNVPDFYEICYQEKSPEGFKYPGIESLSELKDTLYFPLYKAKEKSTYSAQIIGDIQTPGLKEVEFFQDLIVPELFRHPADFKVCLGDIADNDLSVYPSITRAMQAIETPLYMVFGNHDINYKATNASNESETFRRNFGPDYYSFNYGEKHFIVLNTVSYQGWNSEKDKRGSYQGGIHSQQLNWLKQDLDLVPANHQVVLMAHIPLMPSFSDSASISAVFSLLEKFRNNLAIYGHLHISASFEHDTTLLWNGSGIFEGQIAGAACGAWWMGPYGLDSIPDATCTDGTPPGIYFYEFAKDGYDKKFIPAGKHPDFQLRISAPASTLSADSVSEQWVYVNVFDGNENTLVNFSIDQGEIVTMQKVLEVDPYLKRNQYIRFNRNNWTPDLNPSSHLWKAEIPNHLAKGKHTIKATCRLKNGKVYSTYKVFELK